MSNVATLIETKLNALAVEMFCSKQQYDLYQCVEALGMIKQINYEMHAYP